MQVVRLNNPELIRDFVTQPALYERLAEDFSPQPDEWLPSMALSIWLMVYEETENDGIDIWGMFAFVPETEVVYRFHPAVNPTKWGNRKNVEAAQLALEWMWRNTSAQKLAGKVPVIYQDLVQWGQRLGFKREGVQRRSFLRNGELHDQIHMGLNRPDMQG